MIKNYCPTLHIKPAEIKAMEELPRKIKESITPCYIFSPWLNARKIITPIEKIRKSYGEGVFILDIDRSYLSSDKDNPAKTMFRSILNGGEEDWISILRDSGNVIPVVQFFGDDNSIKYMDIIDKYINFDSSKGFCIRIVRDDIFLEKKFLEKKIDMIKSLSKEGYYSYIIIIDLGYLKDDIASIYFVNILKMIKNHISHNTKIVLSYTTFPYDFSDISGVKKINFNNREVFRQVSRETNINLVYGDWASTRPREKGFGATPYPRIDYPLSESWVISRCVDRSGAEGYKAAAAELIHSSFWQKNNLNSWGDNMIEITSKNPSNGIHSARANVAARINIHLYRQAMYDRELHPDDFDEEWREFPND